MTKVVFENATIQDVISKATKIAPTKGGAFDKAAGLMIEVDAEEGEITVRATNLDVYYMEVTDAVEIEGASCKWLLPSDIIAAFASKLPIGSGKQVTFESDGGQLTLKTGRTRAKIHLIHNPYYPEWETFDPDNLSPVAKFGDLLELVQWAAEKSATPPLNGISIDGEYAFATDRFKLARVPLKAGAVYKPVIIPVSVTKVLNKHMGDVEIGLDDSNMLIMPDDSTQIRAVLMAAQPPPVMRLFHGEEPNVVKFKKGNLLEIIERAMIMSGRERTPALRMFLDKERIAVLMVDEHAGQLGDVIDVPGYCLHDQHQIIFSPRTLLDALNRAPNDDVELWYNLSDPIKPVRIEGGSGYQVIVVPRRDLTPISEGGGGD